MRNGLNGSARGWAAFARAGALGAACVVAGAGLGAGSAAAQEEAAYEIWSLDQGTHMLYVHGPDLEEVARVDLGAEGIRAPHMVDFTPDGAYAFIASTGSGDVTVIRAEDREIVARLETGPRTHMAVVKPDGSAAMADVIGSPDEYRDGKLVEIVIGADESFEIGRELLIVDDPVFQQSEDRFADIAPICHQYTEDGRHAYVTLGPGLADGGLLIVDTEEFEITEVFPPEAMQVNCGTVRTVDGRHMFVNGGGADVGVWYVFDTQSHEMVHEAESRGHDAHGVWPTPDGREVWMVNRVSDNAIIIDPQSFEVVHEVEAGAWGETPDIIAMSPDARRAFITLRGPNPISAPHVAVGSTPGFAVVDVETRELVQIVQPDEGNEQSDFHGIGVRVIQD